MDDSKLGRVLRHISNEFEEKRLKLLEEVKTYVIILGEKPYGRTIEVSALPSSECIEWLEIYYNADVWNVGFDIFVGISANPNWQGLEKG